MTIQIRPMVLADIDGVVTVEQQAFTTPWSREAFISEIKDNELALYAVMTDGEAIKGYGGMWRILDEGHITNIALLPECRGLGLGTKLLNHLICMAKEKQIHALTLEVRPSNEAALGLYEKMGFVIKGTRKRYYTDNGEDAHIMWLSLEKLPEDEKKAPVGAKG